MPNGTLLPRSARHERGSVIVFCVVLLSILALLGTSYLLIVRQSGRASSNAMSGGDAGVATQAGLNHALGAIREMVVRSSILSPEGIFDATQPDYVLRPTAPVLNANGTWSFTAMPTPNAYWLFETRDDDTTFPWVSGSNDYTLHAPLYWDPAQRFNDTAISFQDGGTLREPPHFSYSPLGIFAFPNGQARPYGPDGDVFHRLDIARRFFVDGNTLDFYPPHDTDPTKRPNMKATARAGSRRGAYYVWIADLDAKLYANPNDWMIDVTNTLDPATLSYADDAEWTRDLQKKVLQHLRNFGNTDQPAATWGAPSEYLGTELADGDIDHLLDLPAGAELGSIRELALKLHPIEDGGEGGSFDPLTTPSSYMRRRGALDYYFTTHRDIPWPVGNLPIKFTKDSAAALNINTAPVEIIAAALAGIPSETDGETIGTDSFDPERAWHIARRIVAKRPFLCRMDFEDFLAAHIKGEFDPFTRIVDPDIEGDLTTPTDTEIADSAAGAAVSFVRMVHFSISRRWGPGHVETTLQLPELSLSQYLEIPGVAEGDLRFKDGNGWFPNDPRFQKERFEYFFDDATAPTDAQRTNALITPKEFNNIINSVTRIYANDDGQVIYPDLGTVQLDNATVVTCGADNILQTSAQGDDVTLMHLVLGATSTTTPIGDDQIGAGAIEPGVNLKLDTPPNSAEGDYIAPYQILVGPNRLAETWTSNNRPSYYSFCEDHLVAEQFWMDIDNALLANLQAHPELQSIADGETIANTQIAPLLIDPTAMPPSVTIAEHERAAMLQMRFYYRLPLEGASPNPPPYGTPPTPSYDLLTLGHLLSWRCSPTSPTKRAGYYQMSFDDWTWDMYTPNFGMMQSSGNNDPDFGDTLLYSSGKPTSGVPVAPPVDVDGDLVNDGNGDVSWSPQFAFRSRFFGIYVLGRGLISQVSGGNIVINKVTGERRLEAVYDGLKDQLIWQRAQTSDKRALGDPEP